MSAAKDHAFIGDRPTVPADPWAAVEAECRSHRPRAEHAGRLHVLGRAGDVLCVAWRPLVPGERASDAWIGAAGRSGSDVPGARAALYPPPATMAFQMSDGAALDRQADATRAAVSAYYERVRAERGAPAPRRPRRTAVFT